MNKKINEILLKLSFLKDQKFRDFPLVIAYFKKINSEQSGKTTLFFIFLQKNNKIFFLNNSKISFFSIFE